jgi:hypothetical protein
MAHHAFQHIYMWGFYCVTIMMWTLSDVIKFAIGYEYEGTTQVHMHTELLHACVGSLHPPCADVMRLRSTAPMSQRCSTPWAYLLARFRCCSSSASCICGIA